MHPYFQTFAQMTRAWFKPRKQQPIRRKPAFRRGKPALEHLLEKLEDRALLTAALSPPPPTATV